MIKYSGMKAEENGNSSVKQLPAGAYVATVMGARIVGKKPALKLEVMIDIADGPYKDFYMNKFTAQKLRGSQYDVTYKGVLRLNIPDPDNKAALYPESDEKRFNDLIYRFTKSHPDLQLFTDDGFDESKLTNLLIGVSVQEDEYNGSRFTKPVRFEILEDVRNGLIKPMKPRWEKGGNRQDPTQAPMVDQRSGMPVVQTEKLPWD